MIPVVDNAVKVDLREQVREIPHQTSITKDNAAISVDFIWYYKVLDPTDSVIQVVPVISPFPFRLYQFA